MKFHVVSFASEAKAIVNITDLDISGNTDDVIWSLMNFDYQSTTLILFPTFSLRKPLNI